MRCTRRDQTASSVCVLSFGYFSLHKQRKVTGCRATPDDLDCELNPKLKPNQKSKIKKTHYLNSYQKLKPTGPKNSQQTSGVPTLQYLSAYQGI